MLLYFFLGSVTATMETGSEQQIEGKAENPVTLQNTSILRSKLWECLRLWTVPAILAQKSWKLKDSLSCFAAQTECRMREHYTITAGKRDMLSLNWEQIQNEGQQSVSNVKYSSVTSAEQLG